MEIKSPPKCISTTNRLCYQYNHSEVPPKFQFHELPSIELQNEPKLPPRQFPIEPQGPKRHWEAGWDQGMRCNIRFFVDKPIVRAKPPHLTKTYFPLTPTSGHITDRARQSACEMSSSKGEYYPMVQNDLKEEEKEEKSKREEEEKEAEEDKEKKESSEEEEAEAEEKKSEEGEEEEEKRVDEYSEEDPLKGLSQEEINQLAIKAFWTSTTRRMTEQACLPVPKFRPPSSTMERNADMVKYRPHRYDSGPAQWQEIPPPVWDRVQERARIRPRMSYPRPTPSTNKTVFCSMPRINRPRSGRSKGKESCNISVDKNIIDLIKRERLTSTYVRQCPGYAGYRPRSPLRIPMENLHGSSLRMMTTMKASYRPTMLPLINIDHFHHKGPFSHTVTLTYPYNPYGKVEKLRNCGRNDV